MQEQWKLFTEVMTTATSPINTLFFRGHQVGGKPTFLNEIRPGLKITLITGQKLLTNNRSATLRHRFLPNSQRSFTCKCHANNHHRFNGPNHDLKFLFPRKKCSKEVPREHYTNICRTNYNKISQRPQAIITNYIMKLNSLHLSPQNLKK